MKPPYRTGFQGSFSQAGSFSSVNRLEHIRDCFQSSDPQRRRASGAKLSARSASKRARPEPRGSFADLEALLEELGKPPVLELGKPLPSDKYLPKRKPGLTPAQVNRLLLDHSHGNGDHGSL